MTDYEKPLRICCKIEEIIQHITLGYSVRGACLAVGVAPSTGRRWLAQAREIEEANRIPHVPDQDDRPF